MTYFHYDVIFIKCQTFLLKKKDIPCMYHETCILLSRTRNPWNHHTMYTMRCVVHSSAYSGSRGVRMGSQVLLNILYKKKIIY